MLTNERVFGAMTDDAGNLGESFHLLAAAVAGVLTAARGRTMTPSSTEGNTTAGASNQAMGEILHLQQLHE